MNLLDFPETKTMTAKMAAKASVPVRHAYDGALHPVLARLVDDGLEGGDQRLAALQAKPLL